jgi:putative transcriptional regulator
MSTKFTVTSLPIPARRFLTALIAVVTLSLWPPLEAGGRAVPSVGDGDDGLTGRLLVAAESMGDPRFKNTVIYMVEHNAGGAMGLIVNVPFGAMPWAPLFERLGLEAPEAAGGIDVYYGGPVEPDRGFLLHSAEVVTEGSIVVGAGVAMTVEAEMLRRIARGEGPERSLFALGYSGWGPRQLESELARDDWFTIPFDPALVFAVDPARSWERATARRSLDL